MNDPLVPRPPRVLKSSRLVVKEAARVFSDLFPKFKAHAAQVSDALNLCQIPFVWMEDDDVPKQGVLVWQWDARTSQARFDPLRSETSPDATHLAFVEFRPEFYAFEPIMTMAFMEEILGDQPANISAQEDPLTE